MAEILSAHRSLIVKGIACAALFAIAGLLFLEQSAAITDIKEVPVDDRAEYWRDRISAVGASRAYEELAAAIAGITSPQKHFNAHIFGTTLFDAVGMGGTAVCDGRFNYGCFHAFMIRAVEVRGPDAAQELHEACIGALGATAEQCEHGIGHGLLGIIGYGIPDIAEALSICETLSPPSHPIGGCVGGVFMEYGLRGMQGAGQAAMRPFVDDVALEPCLTIDPEHRAACAFWQPMWWMETHPERADGNKMAELMGRWCEELAGESGLLPTCIAGIANRMELLTDGEPTDTSAICKKVTTIPRLQEYCQMKGAMQFTRYHELDFSLAACEGLPPDAVARCRTDATEGSAARLADQAHDVADEP